MSLTYEVRDMQHTVNCLEDSANLVIGYHRRQIKSFGDYDQMLHWYQSDGWGDLCRHASILINQDWCSNSGHPAPRYQQALTNAYTTHLENVEIVKNALKNVPK